MTLIAGIGKNHDPTRYPHGSGQATLGNCGYSRDVRFCPETDQIGVSHYVTRRS
jgi:hypothetical protein